jgi:hypothetical protein
MRPIVCIPLLLILSSCGSATLYTDDLFRSAAPEIVQAWQGLNPGRDAKVRALPPGSGLSVVKAALKQDRTTSTVLMGVTLSEADRRDLAASFPGLRLVFFVPGAENEATITVDRAAAWAVVARAAGVSGGQATVLFPSDATQTDRNRFVQAWKTAGGGTLTAWIWPEVGALPGESRAVFQWVGTDADSRILALRPGVAVHGHPGTVRAQGAGGLTWKIRETGLGDFLWASAQDSRKLRHFLPLETVPANR